MMKLGAVIVLATVTAGFSSETALAAPSYLLSTLDNNSDLTFNQLLGINSAGTIAGYFGSGSFGHPNKGYTLTPPYSQANYTNENFPASQQTQVTGLNNAGVTVGFWVNASGGNLGFTDVGGVFTTVNDPNTPASATAVNQLLGVNSGNTAVGFYTDAIGNNHGYTYSIGTQTFSSPINDPSGISTTTAAINNAGNLAGFFTDSNNVTHGFLDNLGTFTTVDAPGATNTMLLGLNNTGLAVGSDVVNGQTYGIIYNIGTGTFTTLSDPNGIGTTTLNGLNDAGQIVGFYVDAAGNSNGLLGNPVLPVPEPRSIAILCAGLASIALLRRHRKAG